MSVVYLHKVAGKSAVSAVSQDGAVATAWIGDFFKSILSDKIEEGAGWPSDAMFKLEVRYHTWPMGWDKYPSTEFYNTQQELDARLADLKDWALCEDNEVSVKMWEWDLGSNFKGTFHYA